MRVIRAPSAGRAHELVVRSLLEKGTVIDTEDDEATVEGDEIAIRIEHPLTEPMVSPASRFQQRFMEQYAADLLTGSGGRFEYDYHDRLFHWGQGLTSLGHPISRDQVAYIIQKLGTAPVSRRAIAVTWNPAIDEELDDCPCLQLVQCLGLYPIGSLVELNTGEVGVVIQQNSVRRLKPRIMVILNPDKSLPD